MLFFESPVQLLRYLRLTDRQQEYVMVIGRYTAEHGYPPALRDVTKLMKMTSPNGGKWVFNTLRKRGLMTQAPYEHASRSSHLIGITWRQVDLGSGKTA